MLLDSVRVVLVETSHPGNIGASARAMKTMGLRDLWLVAPKMFPDMRAVEMAAGADDILMEARVVSSLDEALAGCQLIVATSARPRGLSLPGLTPAECGELFAGRDHTTKAALLFGREYAGLTNDELLRCHYHTLIPANPEYSSLNLAQAVQVLCYEMRKNLLREKADVAHRQEVLASAEAMEQFYEHLRSVLIRIDFLRPSVPRRLFQRVRRIFNRTTLEETEVNLLRGMLSQMEKVMDGAQGGHKRA